MSENRNNYCLSCNKAFIDDAKFCFECGQSRRSSILSIGELWTNFWTTIFNVDNSFFRTLRLIARPDKLTGLYVAGKRKKHINPIRLFLILLVFLAAAVIYTIDDFGGSDFQLDLNHGYYGSLFLEKFEDKVDGSGLDDRDYALVQGIKDSVFEGLTCIDLDTMFNGNRIIDLDNIMPLTKADFILLSEDEIYEKYKAETYWQKMSYRQYIRVNKDQSAANKYLFNNALWGLIPCILVLSLFLKFLYRHHRISFLEHLIFVANTHSFLFLFLICFILFAHFFINGKNEIKSIVPFIVMANFLFVLTMMILYYKEGFFRSLLKFVLSIIVYGFFGFVFIIMSMVISGFLF